MSHGYRTALVVDDEKNTREGLKRFLEQKNYDVLLAADGQEALGLAAKETIDVALIDLKMPQMDGLTLLHRLHSIKSGVPVIVLTAYGTIETAVQAMKAGAYHYLTKPFNLEELELILTKAFHEKALEVENRDLRQDLFREKFESGKIIGESSQIKKVIQLADQIAASSATVLIQGESGTGKELFAHMIHEKSPRKNQPFVTVHCAALTETLLASELFGHERGAFTGADERKIGRFERANGGSLFLDEIGEISESTQVKLLRFLQDGEFERVGSSKTMRVDVRLICATNKDLQQEVQTGRFREDLYYRINVILLTIPPLRDRSTDIPFLVNHYLDLFARRNQKLIKSITPKALAKLQAYAWPGNIRELRNVMERVVVLATEPVIDVMNLPEDIQTEHFSPRTTKQSNGNAAGISLSHLEKNAIESALRQLQGNKSLVAKQLGISRRTLYRKLDEYQIVSE